MSGKQFDARVAENILINSEARAYLLRLEVPSLATRFTPGQFVHILCGDPEVHPLRRAFAICYAQENPGRITICYHVSGEGTAWLSQCSEGDVLNVMGPLGSGFGKLPFSNVMLVGEGVGIPALLPLAKAYGRHAQVYLSFPTEESVHLAADFEKAGAQVHIYAGKRNRKLLSDARAALRSGRIQGAHMAAEMLTMERLAPYAVERGIPCEVMLTPKLACGVGACRGCTRMMQIGNTRVPKQVCHDGPVFDARIMLWE